MVAVAFAALPAALALWLPCVLHTLPPATPEPCMGSVGCPAQPRFVLPGTPWWEQLGQGQAPARSHLSGAEQGRADTQGASQEITCHLSGDHSAT